MAAPARVFRRPAEDHVRKRVASRPVAKRCLRRSERLRIVFELTPRAGHIAPGPDGAAPRSDARIADSRTPLTRHLPTSNSQRIRSAARTRRCASHSRDLLVVGRRSQWRGLSPDSPAWCSCKSTGHGSALRARRGGPVRRHPPCAVRVCEYRRRGHVRSPARCGQRAPSVRKTARRRSDPRPQRFDAGAADHLVAELIVH